MLVYVARRTLLLAVSLLVASVIVFALLRLLPGNLAQTVLGVNATPEAVAALEARLGTDRPALTQYLDWSGGLLRGDFGISALSGEPIGPQIADRLSVTVPLVLGGLAVALLLSVPLGVLAALSHRRPLGTALVAIGQVGIAVPAFWLGLLLITLFAVRWQLLPAGGFPREGWAATADAVRSLVLPVLVLGTAQGAVLLRYVRSAVLDVLQEDFIRTARATGLSRAQAVRRHALRNAAVPVVTVLGLQLATLLVGAVVIEQVFALPGLGSLLLTDVGNRDVLGVQGVVMALTAAVLVLTFLVDLAYHALDPRMRGRV